MKNEVLNLSYKFSLLIVSFCKRNDHLRTRYYAIYNQLLKSSTSIGANIEEATAAQSRKDFLAKMYIAFKEAKEAHYWLRIVRDSKIAESNDISILLKHADSLKYLLGSITKKTRNNI